MLNRRFAAPLAIFALASGLLLAGCPLPSGTSNPDPSPTGSSAAIPEADIEACEHLNDGPAVAVMASLDAGNAPQVSEAHKRYDIGLVGDNAPYSGKVLYNSKEEADYVFFFTQDVALEVRDAENAPVEIEAIASSSAACGTVKARYEVPLGVGLYTLHLGPVATATVSLVVEASAHDEDHDHAH